MLFPLELSFKIGCDIAFFWLSTMETNLNIVTLSKSSAFKMVLHIDRWQLRSQKEEAKCVFHTCWVFCLGKNQSLKREISLYKHMNSSPCQPSGHGRDSSSSNWDPDVKPFRRYFFCLLLPLHTPKLCKVYLQSGHQLCKGRQKYKQKQNQKSILFGVFLFVWLVRVIFFFFLTVLLVNISIWNYTSFIFASSVSCKHAPLNIIFHVSGESTFKGCHCRLLQVLLFLSYYLMALMLWTRSHIITMMQHKIMGQQVFFFTDLLVVFFSLLMTKSTLKTHWMFDKYSKLHVQATSAKLSLEILGWMSCLSYSYDIFLAGVVLCFDLLVGCFGFFCERVLTSFCTLQYVLQEMMLPQVSPHSKQYPCQL